MHPRTSDYPQTSLPGPFPFESEMTAGTRIEPGKRYGFFTDTSLCIGCKACEVACKEWNGLPADEPFELSGHSYDNTLDLSANTWRHVAFIERITGRDGERPSAMQPFQSNWLMMSDVCKHCTNAACVEACPTGALFYTEFGTVTVQQDICNGCGYCEPACPFHVVKVDENVGRAQKCTLCYDRMKGSLEPACAKVCPTNSIQFGELDELTERAQRRVERLHEQGVDAAYLYGAPDTPGSTGDIGQLGAFFLLLDRPEVYNLPTAPTLPSTRVRSGMLSGLAAMTAVAATALAVFAVDSA